MKKIIILGATGSIGQSALTIAKNFPEHLQVVGLQAHTQYQILTSLGQEFPRAQLALTGNIENVPSSFLTGQNAIKELIQNSDADLVLNGIAGASGLEASIYTLQSKKNLALANKESMVMAGEYLHLLAKENNCSILPVDSEHSALFYLMKTPLIIDEYIITASGGAFRGKNPQELTSVSAKDAQKHPTWQMGIKISIDSATLANKGLEIIEAWKLLHIPIEKIKVLQHPQSLVHALVRTNDGALQAYISHTNMQLPIQNALLDPILRPAPLSYLDLTNQCLTFEEIDHSTFPMIQLAYQACQQASCYPIIYNAVNEVAVALFRDEKITFLQISQYVAKAIKEEYPYAFDPLNLDHIRQADRWSRDVAWQYYKDTLV